MFKHALFTLNGVGYLNEMIHKNGEVYARINVINQFDSSYSNHSDDIWVECLIDKIEENNLLGLMADFEFLLSDNNTIILQFEIEYGQFKTSQTGMTIDDPSHIVHLKGKLTHLNKIYVNGIDYFKYKADVKKLKR